MITIDITVSAYTAPDFRGPLRAMGLGVVFAEPVMWYSVAKTDFELLSA